MFVKGNREEVKAMVLKFYRMGHIIGPATKSLPLSKEEKKVVESFDRDADAIADQLIALKNKHAKFWAGVGVRLDIFDKKLRLNESATEIEIVNEQ